MEDHCRLVALVLGATGVFGHLKDALNTVWEVTPKPGRDITSFALAAGG